MSNLFKIAGCSRFYNSLKKVVGDLVMVFAVHEKAGPIPTGSIPLLTNLLELLSYPFSCTAALLIRSDTANLYAVHVANQINFCNNYK
jgi:hypothetical protein